MRQLQRALALIYPNQCVMCDTRVDLPGALCGPCWRDTPFLTGLVCHACGTSLPGDEDQATFCDDCLTMPRPWAMGRAALAYRDKGRRVVLALKHGDRLDLMPAAARWMVRAGKPVLTDDTLLVPIPVHWTRLLARRYNQAAELARAIANQTRLPFCPDALVRPKRTPSQDGLSVDQRFANLANALHPNPKRMLRLDGRTVCLVDDVMTSGATLTCATQAAFRAGAAHVNVLTLARVEKSP
jgi:predicted amidophosphoribosyltransferase